MDVFALRGEGDYKATRNRRLANQKHPENNDEKLHIDKKKTVISCISIMAPFVFANSLPGLIDEVLKFHLDLSLSPSCAGEDCGGRLE